MRLPNFIHPLVTLALFLGPVTASAGEEKEVTVIVMDEPTAELWRSYFRNIKADVIVRSDDESLVTLNARARSMQNVARVFYRGDKSSFVSRFFRERIANQGVRMVDLAKQFPPKVHQRFKTVGEESLQARHGDSKSHSDRRRSASPQRGKTRFASRAVTH